MTRIRFHGELNELLRRQWRDRAFECRCAANATLKHLIESLGVPHTEVGLVLVDGRPTGLDALVGEHDSVEVHPVLPVPARRPPGASGDGGEAGDARPSPSDEAAPRFLADAHLGGLARRLRLLGFDTLLADDAPDHLLAELADGDGRILLSRDRELLKHRKVTRGRFVRAQRTDEQLREVVRQFGLAGRVRPFSRCLECNAPLRRADRAELAGRLPPDVAAAHTEFTLCTGCGRAYWPGSHWWRLRAVVEAVVAAESEGAAAPG